MKASKIIITIAACCALGAIIYFLAGKEEDVPEQLAPPQETSQEVPGSQTAPQQEPDDDDSAENASVDAEASGETGRKLHEIMLSAMEYYADTVNSTTIITQNGRLYNAAAGIEITTDYLIEKEYLSRDYILEGATVLYVLPDDFAEISPEYARFYNPGDGLKVFVVAPFENGYLVDAKGIGEQLKISAADFGQLLFPYRVDYGEIRRVTGGAEDYPGIISAIKELKGTSSDFYVRYGMRNDKYAVMIVSPKDDYQRIYEFALSNVDNNWSVVASNLETVTKSRAFVNNMCPDMDVALMPVYDVNTYIGMMRKDFDGVTEVLVRDGYISEEDPLPVIEYASSTDKFMFVKYDNGQMFLGVYNGDSWVLGEVLSPEDALARFKSIDERAPDFVIIWE